MPPETIHKNSSSCYQQLPPQQLWPVVAEKPDYSANSQQQPQLVGDIAVAQSQQQWQQILAIRNNSDWQ